MQTIRVNLTKLSTKRGFSISCPKIRKRNVAFFWTGYTVHSVVFFCFKWRKGPLSQMSPGIRIMGDPKSSVVGPASVSQEVLIMFIIQTNPPKKLISPGLDWKVLISLGVPGAPYDQRGSRRDHGRPSACLQNLSILYMRPLDFNLDLQ